MYTDRKEQILCIMCRMLIFRADVMTGVLAYTCPHSE